MGSQKITVEEAERRKIIDKNNLDQECMEQPDLFHKVAKQHALAKSKEAQCKRDYKKIQGRLFIDIKKRPEKYGFDEKKVPTDSMANNLILCLNEYNEAYDEYLEAQKDTLLWESLKDTFGQSQRPSMIRELGSLYLGSYWGLEIRDKSSYSSNKVTADKARESLMERTEVPESLKKLNKRIKRKKR